MTKIWSPLTVICALGLGISAAKGGTIFYQAIPATDSDANSGITDQNGYTTAVDGGNTRGTDRAINDITLYSLIASGNEISANNCTLTALSGSLTNAAGTAAGIRADGTLKEALLDMTFNNGASDNSQQEIVLESSSLEAGVTYDLRVYICNSGGQNRQVNLAFAGDGQGAVETGWFNEDDARTSAGGFNDANQVYYIDYRFTWDGDTTPGVTITQKFGSAPFCLYALTNQVVADNVTAAGEGESISEDLLNDDSDEIGVASDDFYDSESLNANGRWVELDQWGRSWQPTNVPAGWIPYTNGTWRDCEDCGWTFVSDEPWAWACYHYGRWCKVRTGCGWAWVPGRVWAGSWVSWRRCSDESGSCIGWAPLPPQAGCVLNVGISSWVDQRCDIGPNYYVFVNIRDFGSDSYLGCGCIYDRARNVTILRDTINITNIYFNRRMTYAGGPDLKWCNDRIRKFGGKEIARVHVRRFGDPEKARGGKFSHLEGNQLALLSPRVRPEKTPKHLPKISERIGADKIDKGWGVVKDKNQEKQLRDYIARESKGKEARGDKAILPASVAASMGKRHEGKPDGRGRATADKPGEKTVLKPYSLGAGGVPSGRRHPGSKGYQAKPKQPDNPDVNLIPNSESQPFEQKSFKKPQGTLNPGGNLVVPPTNIDTNNAGNANGAPPSGTTLDQRRQSQTYIPQSKTTVVPRQIYQAPQQQMQSQNYNREMRSGNVGVENRGRDQTQSNQQQNQVPRQYQPQIQQQPVQSPPQQQQQQIQQQQQAQPPPEQRQHHPGRGRLPPASPTPGG